ncbi:hypothetical protein FQZ97_1263950 [compost metagenome]
MLIAMRQEEILVAPVLVALVVHARPALAGRAHGRVEVHRVLVVLHPEAIQHRRQVGAAAEPLLARHDHARVHMHRRHMRVPGMDDQRNA